MPGVIKKCWYCDFFQDSDPDLQTGNRSGWCRRWAPKGVDDKSVIDREYYDNFPAVKDGLVEECGEWKPYSTATVPAPPPDH